MSLNKLQKLKCSACSGKTSKLKNLEINENLKNLKNWNVNDEKKMIFKKFIFSNFKNPLKFANSIGKISDLEGHHPDISVGWGYCIVMIHTHAIDGLSINDFILASKIDLLKFN